MNAVLLILLWPDAGVLPPPPVEEEESGHGDRLFRWRLWRQEQDEEEALLLLLS